jgi:hypothetical protein
MKIDQPTPLLRDLLDLSEPDARDEQLRAAVRERLIAQAAQATPAVQLRPRRRARSRLGLAAALAATLAAALALGVAFLGGAGGASAQTVLRRAAAVRLGADQGADFSYSVQRTLSDRTTAGSAEVWIETGSDGTPTRVAETLVIAKDPAGPPVLANRHIETRAGTYSYDQDQNTISVSSGDDLSWSTRATPTVPLPAYLFNGATVAQGLQELGQSGQAGVRLLGQQTVDGVTVDAVQVDGWPDGGSLRATFYFDADSHLLRGFDVVNTEASDNAPSYQVRLTRTETMAAAAVPAGTFTLNAPAGALVEPPPPDTDALSRLCPEFGNGKELLAQGETVLQICQASNPGMTEDELVAALLASPKADLDAAVAAGQITAAQAAVGIAAEKAELEQFVTTSKFDQPPAGGKTAKVEGR